MGNLVVTEYKNIRVLTTQQIAEAYGAEAKKITDNFNNNKSRYIEGKHYICLSGEELRRFKSETENLGFAKNLNKLVSDTKHTVVNLSQSIDILSLYHKGGISNEYKVYR